MRYDLLKNLHAENTLAEQAHAETESYRICHVFTYYFVTNICGRVLHTVKIDRLHSYKYS